jgi:hypothetical protein
MIIFNYIEIKFLCGDKILGSLMSENREGVMHGTRRKAG